MDKYKIVGQLSCGAHGLVLQAERQQSKSTDRKDQQEKLAVKRILIPSSDRMPEEVVREIRSLRILRDQPFIVQLLDLCISNSCVNFIFPLLPSNLSSLIHEYEMTEYQKLACVFMLCDGVRVIHSARLMHRDLKPSNILVDWDGYLKICDFGQSRLLNPDHQNYSHQVATRFYRSPELLFGSTTYGQEVDMWSTGCIIAEIYLKRVLFAAQSDISQLSLIISRLGQPDPEWTGQFPDYRKITFEFDPDSLTQEKKRFRTLIRSHASDQRIADLIFSLIRYTNRETASEILENDLFSDMKSNGLFPDRLLRPEALSHPVGPHGSGNE